MTLAVQMKPFIKKIWFKSWPKLTVTLCGVVLYFFAVTFPDDAKSLLVNISAGLISIPVIFIAYDLWNEKSHRRLNEDAYQYAENEMGQIMLKTKRHMEQLVYGYCVYFDHDDIVVDDSNFANHVVRMNETSKILHDEEGEPYQLKHQIEDYDESEAEDVCELEKDEIVPIMADVRYLGYQVADIGIDDIVEDLNELLKNYFIMKRLDDNESSVIVHLLESAKMLQTFLEATEKDLFLPTDLSVAGFTCKASDKKSVQGGDLTFYSLFYTDAEEHIPHGKSKLQNAHESKHRDHPYEQLLDEKILGSVAEDSLMTVYVVNPDYYIVFGDLVTEVLSCVRNWRQTNAGGVVVDYEYGSIKPL